MLGKKAPAVETGAVAELQREWFGRPLSELFGQIIEACGLTQAQLADCLGMSAPMVSQLMSGRRAKPGNPLVQERIVEFGRALDDYQSHRIDLDQLRSLVTSSGAPVASRTSISHRTAGAPPDTRASAQLIRNLLATSASAEELEGAARLLDKQYPDLATVLRTYGTGRTSEAEAHLRQHGLA